MVSKKREPSLEERIMALGKVVSEIKSHVELSNLDKGAMIRVMEYLAEKYPRSVLNGPILSAPVHKQVREVGVVYYDIGYKLIREQLEREWDQRFAARQGDYGESRALFFNGFFGFLSYNGGPDHKRRMDYSAALYSKKFGLKEMNDNIVWIASRFSELAITGVEALLEFNRRISVARYHAASSQTAPDSDVDFTPIKKAEQMAAYKDTFSRSFYVLGSRMRQITIPGFIIPSTNAA